MEHIMEHIGKVWEHITSLPTVLVPKHGFMVVMRSRVDDVLSDVSEDLESCDLRDVDCVEKPQGVEFEGFIGVTVGFCFLAMAFESFPNPWTCDLMNILERCSCAEILSKGRWMGRKSRCHTECEEGWDDNLHD